MPKTPPVPGPAPYTGRVSDGRASHAPADPDDARSLSDDGGASAGKLDARSRADRVLAPADPGRARDGLLAPARAWRAQAAGVALGPRAAVLFSFFHRDSSKSKRKEAQPSPSPSAAESVDRDLQDVHDG
jgi:hypothetical protein